MNFSSGNSYTSEEMRSWRAQSSWKKEGGQGWEEVEVEESRAVDKKKGGQGWEEEWWQSHTFEEPYFDKLKSWRGA